MGFEPRIVRHDDEDQGGESPTGSRLPAANAPVSRQDESRRDLPRKDLPYGDSSRLREPRSIEPRLLEGFAAGSDRFMLRPDDPELSADLEELAVQLSADAALLEQRYPATPPGQHDRERISWRLLRVTAAATLVVGSMWWVSHQRASEHRNQTAQAAAPEAKPDSGAREKVGSAVRTNETRETTPKQSGQLVRTADAADAVSAPLDKTAVEHDNALVRTADPTENETHLAAGNSNGLRRVGHVAELSFGATEDLPDSVPRDRIGMLEAQLSAFEKVISKLQAEVHRRDQLLKESNELIKTLSAEVQTLRAEQAATERGAGQPAPATP